MRAEQLGAPSLLCVTPPLQQELPTCGEDDLVCTFYPGERWEGTGCGYGLLKDGIFGVDSGFVQDVNVNVYGSDMDRAGTACSSEDSNLGSCTFHEDFGMNLIEKLDLEPYLDNVRILQDVWPRTCAESDTNTKLFGYTSPLGSKLDVYRTCAAGICSCVHYLGDSRNQLEPCRFASILNLCAVGPS